MIDQIVTITNVAQYISPILIALHSTSYVLSFLLGISLDYACMVCVHVCV